MTNVRQSFVNDMLVCPRRAKYVYVDKRQTRPKVPFAVGGSVHVALQSYFNDAFADTRQPIEVVLQSYRKELAKRYDEFPTTADYDDVLKQLTAQTELVEPVLAQYIKEVCAKIFPIAVEKPFAHYLDQHHRATGTIDLVDADEYIWDHKTSAAAYTQEYADAQIQPTAYYLGYWNIFHGWPRGFRYGVMVKSTRTIQIVTTYRDGDAIKWYRRLAWEFGEAFDKDIFLPNPQAKIHNAKDCEFWDDCMKMGQIPVPPEWRAGP